MEQGRKTQISKRKEDVKLCKLPFLYEIIHQFLEDNEEGMRQLIINFLNAVMEEEARIQSGAMPYERTSSRKAHRFIKKIAEELANVSCTFYKGCAEKGAEERVKKDIAQVKRFACECREFEEVHGRA